MNYSVPLLIYLSAITAMHGGLGVVFTKMIIWVKCLRAKKWVKSFFVKFKYLRLRLLKYKENANNCDTVYYYKHSS